MIYIPIFVNIVLLLLFGYRYLFFSLFLYLYEPLSDAAGAYGTGNFHRDTSVAAIETPSNTNKKAGKKTLPSPLPHIAGRLAHSLPMSCLSQKERGRIPSTFCKSWRIRKPPRRRAPPRYGATDCTWPYGRNATSNRS